MLNQSWTYCAIMYLLYSLVPHCLLSLMGTRISLYLYTLEIIQVGCDQEYLGLYGIIPQERYTYCIIHKNSNENEHVLLLLSMVWKLNRHLLNIGTFLCGNKLPLDFPLTPNETESRGNKKTRDTRSLETRFKMYTLIRYNTRFKQWTEVRRCDWLEQRRINW